MTDVARKIRTSAPINNNRMVTGVTNCYSNGGSGVYQARARGTNESVPMSGVNGQTNNGYLDIRFDDPTYYDA